MSEKITFDVTVQIKHQLARLKRADKKHVLWSLLKDELAADPMSITPFMDDLGKFLDEQGDRLTGQFN